MAKTTDIGFERFECDFVANPNTAFIKPKQEIRDVVEVVRCTDCKHFRRNLENDTYCNCVGGLTDPEEYDFCSYGERKEN